MNLLKKIIKLFLFSIIGLILISFYLIIFHSFREQSNLFEHDSDKDGIVDAMDWDVDNDGIKNFEDKDADGDGIENLVDIKNNAKDLKGTFYEYLKGKFNNIGSKLGFLVCYDIPRISYQKAGLSLDLLLRDDYKIHKEFYNAEYGNNLPNSPFFFRRTRNLYSYCQANNRLILNCRKPKPGDVIFYSRFHIALVIEVHNNGKYDEIETAPWTIFVVEHKNREWKPKNIGRIL